MTLRRFKRYLDAQQHLWLHWIGLQGQCVNRENYSRASAYSQLHVSRCGLTIRAKHRIIEQKPQKSITKQAKCLRRQFWGCSSPVVALTLPQTRKGRCPTAEESFGMCNICIHTIVFELSLSKKARKKKERKKKEEQNRHFHAWLRTW